MQHHLPAFGKLATMRTVAFWLSLILIFIIPWENMVNIAGIGTLSRTAGIAVAAFWVATVAVTGRIRKPALFHIAVALFILWNAASFFWSRDLDLTVERLISYVQHFVFIYIIWDLYTTRATLKAGLQAYVLGGYVSICSTVVNYLAGDTQGEHHIYAATNFGTDTIGFILALGMPLAWYLAVSPDNQKTSRVLKLLNYGYIPAAYLGIALAGNRAGLIATVPTILFGLLLLTHLKLPARILAVVLLMSTVFILEPLVPQTSYDRLGTIGEEFANADLNGRVPIWREGLAALVEHPIVGVGTGAFHTVNSFGKVAHNVFLSILVELGVIGFLLFGIILTIVIRAAMRQSKWDSRFWLTVLLVWAIGASALTWEQRKQTWLFLSLVVVSASVSGRRDESISRSGFSRSIGLSNSPRFQPSMSVTQTGSRLYLE